MLRQLAHRVGSSHEAPPRRTVLLRSLRPAHRQLLERVGALIALAHDAHLSPSTEAALDHPHRHVLRNRELVLSG